MHTNCITTGLFVPSTAPRLRFVLRSARTFGRRLWHRSAAGTTVLGRDAGWEAEEVREAREARAAGATTIAVGAETEETGTMTAAVVTATMTVAGATGMTITVGREYGMTVIVIYKGMRTGARYGP